jgi:hypothetical protein
MITGFFRRKERTSRRPTFPIEPRWPFYKRRVRETAHAVAGYAKIAFEMQELWLATRIRRDDYWFVGDLRRLGPGSVEAIRLQWTRLHAALAPVLASAQQRLGATATVFSATMRARTEAVREAMGERANAASQALDRLLPARARVNAVREGAGPGSSEPVAALHAVLADLRLPELPPAAVPTALRRRLTRLNPFAIESLEPDPSLVAYWQRTNAKIARLQLWRLNPFAFTWNLVRGTRRTIIFLFAMQAERY